MKTREQFIQHWQDRLLGIALTGLIYDSDQRPSGPTSAAHYARKQIEKIASLLDEMYVWLEADAQPLQRSEKNGQQTNPRPGKPS